MGIFNKIVNVFYEEDHARPKPSRQSAASTTASAPPANTGNIGSTANTNPKNQNTTLATPAASNTTSSHYTPRTHVPNDDEVYQKFCESLQRAIEAANLPGFDLYEFHSLYKKFLSNGKSEAEALSTALTSAETMRVDKNILISNFQHYNSVLNSQKQSFDQDLEDFQKQNISEPKRVGGDIDRQMEEKNRLILQNQQDIENLEQQKVDLGVNVEKAEKQIQNVNAAFQKAFNEATSDFNELFEKLKTL
ncbi:MAG: hypothetical protein ABUK01_06725 [Leptospirales bacterium]